MNAPCTVTLTRAEVEYLRSCCALKPALLRLLDTARVTPQGAVLDIDDETALAYLGAFTARIKQVCARPAPAADETKVLKRLIAKFRASAQLIVLPARLTDRRA